ncbi:MAG: MltA domain-containing protein [Sedimentisphaerales bacterium]|nr:MltA domain-containing protein [Sedimentisphaerales bacterium]
MKLTFWLTSALLVATLAIGCKTPPEISPGLDYNRPLPPGQLALRKITDPTEIPNFTPGCFDLQGLRQAAQHSLDYLAKPSSRKFFPYGPITHQHAVNSLQAFVDLLDQGLTGSALAEAVQKNFDVYTSVGCDDQGTVLFTGYYTPIFDGSRTRTETFKFPLYKLPDDLVKDEDGNTLGQRLPDNSLVTYPDRALIESSQMLAGTEIFWLRDPFEIYIAHVQGSAKIRLSDNSLITAAYAGNNGLEYQSIATELVKDGKIPPEKLSLDAMIDFFKRNPSQIQTYTRRNPRFVFFRESQAPPHGSINTPVTELRSIATDKSIFPRACLTFITTKLPRTAFGKITREPYGGFALDQDTGGAIRAPGRCDVYMGIGPDAGKRAGQTFQQGRLYYLFLKQPS